jgi:hypothetical protein
MYLIPVPTSQSAINELLPYARVIPLPPISSEMGPSASYVQVFQLQNAIFVFAFSDYLAPSFAVYLGL